MGEAWIIDASEDTSRHESKARARCGKFTQKLLSTVLSALVERTG